MNKKERKQCPIKAGALISVETCNRIFYGDLCKRECEQEKKKPKKNPTSMHDCFKW